MERRNRTAAVGPIIFGRFEGGGSGGGFVCSGSGGAEAVGITLLEGVDDEGLDDEGVDDGAELDDAVANVSMQYVSFFSITLSPLGHVSFWVQQ